MKAEFQEIKADLKRLQTHFYKCIHVIIEQNQEIKKLKKENEKLKKWIVVNIGGKK